MIQIPHALTTARQGRKDAQAQQCKHPETRTALASPRLIIGLRPRSTQLLTSFDSVRQKSPGYKKKMRETKDGSLGFNLHRMLWTSEVSGPVNGFSQALAKTAMPGPGFKYLENLLGTKKASTHKHVLEKRARQHYLLKRASRSTRLSLCHRSDYQNMIHNSPNRLERNCS